MNHQRLSKQGKKLFLSLVLFVVVILSTNFVLGADQTTLTGQNFGGDSDFTRIAVGEGLSINRYNHFGNSINTAQKICSLTEDYYIELGLDKPYPVYVGKTSNWFANCGNDKNNLWKNGGWVNEGACILNAYLTTVTCEALPDYVSECENGDDDDNDGLIDEEDPGCWDDINNPNTYNSDLNDESRADAECIYDSECGSDYYVNHCSGSNVYRTVHEPFCGVNLQCGENVYEQFVSACSQGCFNGACVSPKCSDGLDNDGDGLFDMNDPGCESPADNDEIDCYSRSDCPDDVCAGGLNYCFNNDVYQDFNIFSCVSAGLNNAKCSSNQEPRKILECGDDSCGDYGNNYCFNNDVYHDRTCYDKGCSNRECFSNSFTESILFNDCNYGCSNGACLLECYDDDDCATGYICESNQCVEEPECQDGVDNDGDLLIDSLDPGCWNDINNPLSYNPNLNNEGRAGIECSVDSECGVDGYVGAGFCKTGDAYRYYKEFTCNSPGLGSASCSNNIREVLINDCDYGCNAGLCLAPAECEDGTDNDNDGLIDAADPGCWDDINNPLTYDPKNNEEASAGIECFVDSVCGVDVFVGEKYCSGGDVYQNFKDFFCSNPGLGSADCSSGTNKVLVDECEYGCKDGKCKGDDNDGDDWQCYPGEDCYGDEENVVLDEISSPNFNTEGDYAVINEAVVVGGVSSGVDDEKNSSNWKFFWIFILILLIVVLIILIIAALV